MTLYIYCFSFTANCYCEVKRRDTPAHSHRFIINMAQYLILRRPVKLLKTRTFALKLHINALLYQKIVILQI